MLEIVRLRKLLLRVLPAVLVSAGVLAEAVDAGERAGEGAALPLPQPKYQVELERSIMVPMRDGTRLSTDLYFPAQLRGKRLPAILIRTPYNKNSWRDASTANGGRGAAARMFAGQGYVVAVQDMRGKWESEGTFSIFSHVATDFPDSMDWIVRQPWSDGKVGTYGCSYLGEVQVIGATFNHPAHKAMIPQAAGGALGGAAGRYRYFGARNGGAFELGMGLSWFMQAGSRYYWRPPPGLDRETFLAIAPLYNPGPTVTYDYHEAVRSLPLVGLVRRFGGPVTDWDDFVSWSMTDPRWEQRGYVTAGDRTAVPGLHVNSWYDFGAADTIATWRYFSGDGGAGEDRDNQYLIMGAGNHCTNEAVTENTVIGARPAGDARADHWKTYLAWYDRWLRGNRHALDAVPKVQYYLLGKNEWRSAESFPPAGARQVAYFIGSGGRANSLLGDGRLQPGAVPPGGADADRFTYDPGNPVPSLGGPVCCTTDDDMAEGSFDQTPVESRADVLVYQTPALEKGVTVAGPIELVLFVSSDAPDTDFVAKLVDVYPDGRAFNVQEGILRARYRDGIARPLMMTAGEVYEIRLDLQATANHFAPGHKMRLEISSSNFPRWDRNLNTGGDNVTETKWRVARNVVHHSQVHPSRLMLWVLPE